jgi:peptidoglycan/LPS O-acetylase OafA/YrhL
LGPRPAPRSHAPYRADIDGLRAVDVLAVLGFHAFPKGLGGGFAGVDVFFVVSGFLISGILLEALDGGSFSFTGFYIRRIRRIFPALLLVLLACLALGWWALLVPEYRQLGLHTAGGAGFAANLLLWCESGYFDNAAETKPLLHLWSLGIEEQYYIVWPLLLWAAWKTRFNGLVLVIALAAASFALNVGGIAADPVGSFYSPLTRAWELLAGSVLAWYQHRRPPAEFNGASKSVARGVLSVLGLALIALGLALLDKTRPFPGWWALLPVAGTLLVIAAGPQAWANRALLSRRGLVAVGLISYPLAVPVALAAAGLPAHQRGRNAQRRAAPGRAGLVLRAGRADRPVGGTAAALRAAPGAEGRLAAGADAGHRRRRLRGVRSKWPARSRGTGVSTAHGGAEPGLSARTLPQ